MLRLGAFAGLRSDEIARVHTRNVEPEGLRIRGTGGTVRVVPISPELAVSGQGSHAGWGSVPAALSPHTPTKHGLLVQARLGLTWLPRCEAEYRPPTTATRTPSSRVSRTGGGMAHPVGW